MKIIAILGLAATIAMLAAWATPVPAAVLGL
jgi:hypothetical protein